MYAVSNHYGSLAFGHYTACCKSSDGGWYDFNDSSVSKITHESEIVSKSAYVLYYKRRDFYPNLDELDFSAIRLKSETVEEEKKEEQ